MPGDTGQERRGLSLRLGFVVLLSAGLMLADNRLSFLGQVRAWLSAPLYPLQSLVSNGADLGRSVAGWFTSRESLREENVSLRKEHLRWRARLQRYEVLEAENSRLRALLESSARLEDPVLLAETLSIGLRPEQHTLVLNKGERDGVFIGQPVVDADGVVGQVQRVGARSSTVILLTNASHALPARLDRSGLRAVVAGTGFGDRLLLNFVLPNADVRVGDLVVTSGLGGRFPSGYPVGRVLSLEWGANALTRAVVRPAAQPGRSRELLLIQRPSAAPPVRTAHQVLP